MCVSIIETERNDRENVAYMTGLLRRDYTNCGKRRILIDFSE